MSTSRTYAVDGAVALCLAFALGIVFLADSTRGTRPTDGGPVILTSEPSPQTPLAPPIKLAVTPREYDDMGKLLGHLGSGYPFTQIPLEDLEDASKLVGYDVIFLTCGGVADSWVVGETGQNGGRPGTRQVNVDERKIGHVREAVRAYVGRGGTLYASDWRLDLLVHCFPETFQAGEIVKGDAQTLTADVVDPALREYLGCSTVELRFDLPNWNPAKFTDSQATIYLRGNYRAVGGGSSESVPLLVKVPFQQGTIIFTSFHNEKVNSEVETKLLKFLVFAAVTARESANAQRTMISGGFKPQKQSLLGIL